MKNRLIPQVQKIIKQSCKIKCFKIEIINQNLKLLNYEQNLISTQEQLISQDNRIRNLENELQSQTFNQKLNTIRMPYTSDQLFPNQQQLLQSNTPKSSFNNQFNFHK